MSTDAEPLWNALTSRNTQRLVDQMRAASPPSTDAARKPYVIPQGREDATHAGFGSVEAGPTVRYWTVKFRHGGSRLWDYTAVTACDPFKAALMAHKQQPLVTELEVVREIQRDEYEHLTRKSP